jgi:hypothetical protein
MKKAARRRLSSFYGPAYFDAAFMAAEAAMFAELAASVAAEAAVIAELIAAEAAPVSAGGVVTTVVELDGVVVVVAGGVVVVVVVSSFFVQAAKEMAAARVTISSAVFMFLLVLKFVINGRVGDLLGKEPQRLKDLERADNSSA